MVKNGQNDQNGRKWSKWFQMVQNGLKWSKMVQNGPKWSKWSKMVKNGGPDLKRAQRTGLSARRARRTKSSRPEGPKAGPKGRYLEVGARRAPRLLVIYIVSTAYLYIFISSKL